jgi:hypothetical protein
VKPPIADLASTAPEVKDNQILQDFNGDMSLTSVQPSVKVKTEEDESNSRGILNTQSSPLGDEKDTGISSVQMSENSKVNDAPLSCSQSSDHIQDAQSSDHKHDAERSSEAVSDYHVDKCDELSGGPCQLKRLEDSECSVAVKKIPSEAKHVLGFSEERSRSGVTILNSSAQPSQHKMVVPVGKSSSASSTIVPSKSSTTDDFKPADTQNPNPITMQRATSDCNVRNKKDLASSDVVKVEEKDDLPRNTVKERSKSSENSALKASHSSRISHDSVPKRTVSDSKDSVLHSTSKSTSAQNIVPSTGSGESAGSLHHQKSLHAQNKTPAPGLFQRVEKFHQASFLPSSKMNQSHGPSGHPPASNSPAILSDEEV